MTLRADRSEVLEIVENVRQDALETCAKHAPLAASSSARPLSLRRDPAQPLVLACRAFIAVVT
ncbi:MAG TPA: hypothetical protein VFR73_02425 [Hyphomicrobiaceae bacterium]|nr:hypothetical protein [Hyphomicrobiaceae bacterium]